MYYVTNHLSFLPLILCTKKIPPVPFLSADEEDYMVEQYTIQGFKNSEYSFLSSDIISHFSCF